MRQRAGNAFGWWALALVIGLLAGGCAPPPPAASGTDGAATGQTPGTAQPPSFAQPATKCEGAAAPAWASQTGTLQAVGQSTQSFEDAEQAGRVAVAKQLEVQVEGEDASVQEESSAKGFSYQIRSKVVERVSLTISGFETLKRYRDDCRGLHYALVRLDPVKAVQAWQDDLRTLANQRQELARQVADHQRDGRVLAQLDGLVRILELDAKAAALERRLAYLAPEARPAESGAVKLEQTRRLVDDLVGALQLRKQGGDNQAAKPGKPLPQPLATRFVAALPTGEVALANVPIRFTFKTGQGQVDPLVNTNGEGRAEATVHGVEPGTAPVSVGAQVALDRLGNLSPILHKRLERQLAAQEVRFSITPPAGLSADAGPLAKALHELALRLASHINTSEGAPAVVQDFVESRTKRKLPLSARIESGLASGLVRTGVLRIIEKPPTAAVRDPSPAATRQSEGEKGPQPLALVYGVYEANPDDSISITAKLFRVADQFLEATAEGTIPKAALSEGDLRELRLGRPTLGPILAPPAPTQSYSEWVEAFWDLRNPDGFKTELTADRPQIRRGETAQFRLRTTRDCYLTVVSIGASGAWTVLLPNLWRPAPTLVRAGEWVTIPGREDDYEFGVDPDKPVGTERLKAICTTKPVTLIENMDLRSGLFGLSRQDEARYRDLKVSKARPQPDEWSEAHAEIVTLEAGQTETRGMRSLKSRGLDAGRE
ncbi:DUF4384 domain-containing protein [Nitrospira sp. Kam-Ns4a]